MAVLFTSLVIVSCKDKNDDIVEPFPVRVTQTISGNITTNTTLDANKVWILEGYVRVMDGATLTIEPGTLIKGKKASGTIANSALIVERGGKINAAGTATKPIIFTSAQPVGARSIGSWGGVVICGKSRTNISGGVGQFEQGVLGTGIADFGSATPVLNDNSGVLKYVRIEYAGVAIQPDKEINGLTLAGVGSGTVVENVQVTYSGDDAFEFLGGTVNCKNLIAHRNTDDDFNFGFGYTGTIQFAVSIKDPNIADAAGASNGIECENGTTEADQPYTRPVLSNFTLIGTGAGSLDKHNSGALFGKGTQFVLVNSIIVNHLKGGVEISTAQAGTNLTSGASLLKNNLIFAVANPFKVSNGAFGGVAATFQTFATSVANSNSTLASLAAAGFISTDLITPNLTLALTSSAKTGASFTGLTGLGFDDTVVYRGAFNADNWTSGWADFSPSTNIY